MNKIKNLVYHPYTKGIFFVTTGNIVVNICTYFFHLIGGRYLGPSGYGSLASLVSLLYLISILTGVFSTTALRELTKLWARKEKNKFYFLLKSFFSFFTAWGVALFLMFFLLGAFIANYLNLESKNFVYLMGMIGFLSMINSPWSVFQQATLRFKVLSFLNAFISVLKLIFVFLTWYLNLQIYGMLGAMILSSIVYFFLSLCDFLLFVKKNFQKGAQKEQIRFSPLKFLKESSFILAANLGMTGFLTSDTILVKHFFPPIESGLYAGVAVMGRVILYATGSLMTVMFPFLIKRRVQKTNYRKIFFFTFGLVFFGSLFLVLLYNFFPKIIVLLFYGGKYLDALPYLPPFSLYMLFYTLSGVFGTYFVSMEEKKILLLPSVAAFAQVVLIYLFHQNLYQIIKASIFCTALLLGVFLVKFVMMEREK